MSSEELEQKFYLEWLRLYPQFELESHVKLLDKRKFEADFLHRSSKTVIEIQGGTEAYGANRGRHSRPQGQKSDYEKLLLFAEQGYQTLYLTRSLMTPKAYRTIANIIELRLKNETDY